MSHPSDSPIPFAFLHVFIPRSPHFLLIFLPSVGAACVAGQYGVGIQCKTCPSGTNSVAKSDDIDQCITGKLRGSQLHHLVNIKNLQL